MNVRINNRMFVFIVVVAITFKCSGVAYATTTSSVNCSFNTGGSGKAYVNGDQNGIYHPLKSGTASLKITSTTASNGKNAIKML